MKKYIQNNLEPLVIGLAIGIAYMSTLTVIDDACVKIALIINGYK